MSRRKVTANVIGLAGCVALAWGIHGLMLTGNCGGDGAPPCPPESTPYFIATTVGLIVAIVAAVTGGSLSGFAVFPGIGIGIGAVWAGLELPPGQGAVPLAIGATFMAVLLLPVLFVPFAIRKQRRAARIVKEGVAGIGTVTDVRDTGVTVNNNPRVELTVNIEPQNGSRPFAANKTFTVPRVEIPRRGHRFPVWYLPAAPDDFVYGTRVTAGASPEVRRLFALAESGGAQAGGAFGADPGQAFDADPLDRLAKLHELRMAGALTESEFETQKARILSAE